MSKRVLRELDLAHVVMTPSSLRLVVVRESRVNLDLALNQVQLRLGLTLNNRPQVIVQLSCFSNDLFRCFFLQEYLSNSGSVETNILRVQAIGESICEYYLQTL